MMLRYWLGLLCLAVGVSAQITFNEGETVAFGDRLANVEAQLKEKSFDVERGRPGIDRLIATTTALLTFDSDRLWRVSLKPSHLMLKPLTPFREDWKNLSPIGGQSIAARMSREAFATYLEAWKQRAESLGKRERTDYWITETNVPRTGDHVTILFAPRRQSYGTGELTGDTWSFSFTGEIVRRFSEKSAVGVLADVVVTCDEFSTQRRAPAEPFVTAPRVNGGPLAAAGELGGRVHLDDGKTVRFGQSLPELENALGASSRDAGLSIARADVDRQIAIKNAILDFDSGRLRSIELHDEHAFSQPLHVFDESWKNPDPVNDERLLRRMERSEFDAYLEAWKARAIGAGKREGIHFILSTSSLLETHAMIHVALAPFRLTPNGRGVWSDSWTATFAGTGKDGTLESLRLHLDAFNTSARPRTGQRDPALTGVTLPDGTELYFGQAMAEVEALTGAPATLAGSRTSAHSSALRRIQLPTAWVTFDSERLARIAYRTFSEPLKPFPEHWKNLTPIGVQAITVGMTKDDFLRYLTAWEERAASQGMVKGKNFSVRDTTGERSESVMLSLPGARISTTGVRKGDGWVASFMWVGQPPTRKTQLTSLEAIRGEFDTRGPSPATQRKQDIKEMANDIPSLDLPSPELTLPKL